MFQKCMFLVDAPKNSQSMEGTPPNYSWLYSYRIRFVDTHINDTRFRDESNTTILGNKDKQKNKIQTYWICNNWTHRCKQIITFYLGSAVGRPWGRRGAVADGFQCLTNVYKRSKIFVWLLFARVNNVKRMWLRIVHQIQILNFQFVLVIMLKWFYKCTPLQAIVK